MCKFEHVFSDTSGRIVVCCWWLVVVRARSQASGYTAAIRLIVRPIF
jgi:hypothetical protein